ncbi:uncharacterized protein EMH_0003420 [Eimeria mitis]|uniref:Uncharacterized protein n=1 Tax=Eimeria mitis TaxID=44415 RepID=U6JV06_9EIME|nr:uncharacterized protein EMH_0003420 [Eimeria mitis]CDJ29259.1 hypothetical protein EMH_0003420 [Eimeria mitis]
MVELCLELEATSPDLMAHPPPPQPVQQPHVTLPQQDMLELLPALPMEFLQSQSATPSFSPFSGEHVPLPVSTLPQQPQQDIFAPLEHLLSPPAGSAVVTEPLSQQPHSSSFTAANWWSAFPPAHPTTTASSYYEGMGQGLETSSSATSQVLPSVPSQQVEISVGSKRGRPAASSPPPAKRTKGNVSSAEEHGGVAGHPSVDGGEGQQPSWGASSLSPDSWLSPSSFGLPLDSPSYSSLYAPELEESGPSRRQPDGGYAPQPQHTPPVQQDADAAAGARPAGASSEDSLLSILLRRPRATASASGSADASATSSASTASDDEEESGESSPEESAGAVDSHPFYRLPSLLPGVWTPPFFLGTIDEEFLKPPRLVHTCLSSLRELFLKQELDQKDAEAVRSAAVRLARYMHRRQNEPMKGMCPVRVAYYLGRRYLMLDAIFSAILVLGPSPEALENWREFANGIPTDPHFIYKKGCGKKFKRNMRFVKRLNEAVKQLKSGVRPSAKETVELKRFLLCELRNNEFKRGTYDPWRLDDVAFRKGKTR